MTQAITTQDQLIAALRALRAAPPNGFAERVLTQVGLPGEVDGFVLIEGPTGPLFVAFGPAGISHVLAACLIDGDPERFAARHRQRFGRQLRPATVPPPGLFGALQTGQARRLAFDLRGLSGFEQAVLGKALEIPRGEMRPYGWVAREIGRPKAVRAVGSALGRNPVPILIPCHRVVRADGQIGEYAFGSPMKQALLEAEGVDVVESERQARGGARYVGSDTTHIFCHPSCRDARRITIEHQVRFRHASQATAAGFRPCAHCRPAEPSPV